MKNFKTYNSELIADYFLSRSDPEVGDLLSNLKLQKLCYYAAGFCAVVRSDRAPLFDDKIEAWLHGPVVPKLYHKFKHHGADSIPPAENFDAAELAQHDLALLDDIYSSFGQYSAWKLRNMTHEEEPWQKSYQSEDKIISTAALAEYFSKEIERSYIDSYIKTAAGQ